MADLGLLAGLAQGLSQGVGAYKEGERYKQEQALKQRMAKLQEGDVYAKGLEEVADPNDPSQTTWQFRKGMDPVSIKKADFLSDVEKALAIKAGEQKLSDDHTSGLIDKLNPIPAIKNFFGYGDKPHAPAPQGVPAQNPPAQMLGSNKNGLIQNANAGNKQGPVEVKRQRNKKTGKIKIIYDDGSEKIQ